MKTPNDFREMEAKLWDAVDVVSCDVENINRGGCGVFAVALCDELNAHGFTDAKIRIYNYDVPPDVFVVPNLCTVEENLDDPGNVESWRDVGASFVHIVVEFNGRLWDSEGSVKVENGARWQRQYVLCDGHISLESMRKMVDNPHGWNPIFSRYDIPRLKELLEYALI